eukprot:CAMPEP_0202451324 /NCGR_PEP_ID=MMETSP1360-20130828/9788_1 /ASSEMBLY_ACC=CAM_ASM_000848 /TAXON_ID=515479 /ORGANISM="Licmophora paradoxa, Strain CCMP2313" /LENGTH=64 /DNA_ID=CAMNT_0049069875 /DNA_START=18 /DNA_END=209 /DNA_ORIENTATION=-
MQLFFKASPPTSVPSKALASSLVSPTSSPKKKSSFRDLYRCQSCGVEKPRSKFRRSSSNSSNNN